MTQQHINPFHAGRRVQLAQLLAAGDDRAAAALLSNSSEAIANDLTPEQAARIAAVPPVPVDRGLPAVPPRAVPGRLGQLVEPTGIAATKQRTRKRAA